MDKYCWTHDISISLAVLHCKLTSVGEVKKLTAASLFFSSMNRDSSEMNRKKRKQHVNSFTVFSRKQASKSADILCLCQSHDSHLACHGGLLSLPMVVLWCGVCQRPASWSEMKMTDCQTVFVSTNRQLEPASCPGVWSSLYCLKPPGHKVKVLSKLKSTEKEGWRCVGGASSGGDGWVQTVSNKTNCIMWPRQQQQVFLLLFVQHVPGSKSDVEHVVSDRKSTVWG